MRKKISWALALGIVLAVLSIPASAYLLLWISQMGSLNPYLSWGLSSALVSLFVLFPAGLTIFKDRAILLGGLVGLVAALALIVVSIILGEAAGPLFWVEYASMVAFSAMSSYAGSVFKRRFFPFMHSSEY